MNKKQKKQIDVLRRKLAQLRQQLAGEKRQMDDPDGVRRLETEIAQLEEQLRRLEAEAG